MPAYTAVALAGGGRAHVCVPDKILRAPIRPVNRASVFLFFFGWGGGFMCVFAFSALDGGFECGIFGFLRTDFAGMLREPTIIFCL